MRIIKRTFIILAVCAAALGILYWCQPLFKKVYPYQAPSEAVLKSVQEAVRKTDLPDELEASGEFRDVYQWDEKNYRAVRVEQHSSGWYHVHIPEGLSGTKELLYPGDPNIIRSFLISREQEYDSGLEEYFSNPQIIISVIRCYTDENLALMFLSNYTDSYDRNKTLINGIAYESYKYDDGFCLAYSFPAVRQVIFRKITDQAYIVAEGWGMDEIGEKEMAKVIRSVEDSYIRRERFLPEHTHVWIPEKLPMASGGGSIFETAEYEKEKCMFCGKEYGPEE